MDICPHCGSPGSFKDVPDGRCPVCGMALPSEGEPGELTADIPEPVQQEQLSASTLRPATVAPGEKATIDFAGPPPTEDSESGLPHGKDLIRPRKLSPEFARRMTAAWQRTHSQFRDPTETIKSESSGILEIGELNVGSRLVGPVEDIGLKDYALKEIIGQGAMGTVWSARQASLDRDVAIKVPRGAAKTDLGRQQFMSEVVVTGQLDHPNIVPIYELGKDSSGELFYSMKRVEGRPWNEILEERERSLEENLEILMKVCDAVRFAHDRGVIHRDIKPQNIMIGRYGEVSVMDWGIALRLDIDAPHTAISRISPAGTPAYMAPEMATGSVGAIGPATDVYLLGAVLYEILTGEPPHPPPYDSQDQRQILTDALRIAARNEIALIEQEGELADISYRALATEIAHRYQSVEEFQTAIRTYLSHVESVKLTERGVELLQRAKANGHVSHGQEGARFDDFDHARFAFDEAIQIWPGNRLALESKEETLLAYANYAYDEGAYARGIALLNEENEAHKGLLQKLKTAHRRTARLSILLKAAVLLIIVGGSVFSFFLWRARNAAVAAKNVAIEAQKSEEAAKNAAIDAKNAALDAKQAEEDAKNRALAAKKAEEDAKNKALAAQKSEEEAKNKAIAAKEAEEAAKDEAIAAQKEAQRSSYAFEIGLAAEELQRNSFDRAREILTSQAQSETKRPLRNWEWGHLESLVNLSAKSFDDRGKLLGGRVEATAVSENGEWVAAGTSDGDLYVWRFDRSEQPVRLHYGQAVNAILITDDGSTLWAAGRMEDGAHALKQWALPARESAEPEKLLGSFAAQILSLDMAGDESLLLIGCADGKAVLMPRDRPNETITFVATSQENNIWDANFSPDGKWITTAGEDGTVRVWGVTSAGAEMTVKEVRRFEVHEGPVYAAVFSPDGTYIVSGGRDRKLLAVRFNAEDVGSAAYSPKAVVQSRLSGSRDDLQASEATLLGEHESAVHSISFSADGSVLFSGGDDHTVRVWNTARGFGNFSLLKTLRGHGGWVRSCVAVPNDPSSVLSGGYDRRVKIWNWQTYNFPIVLRHESARSLGELQLTAGAASPDGRWIAAASSSGVVTLWDLMDPLNPRPLELAEGHDWQATAGVYFSGGQKLLTAGGDNTAIVWDEPRGNELVRIGGWNQESGAGWRGVATVSKDGRWIATGAQGEILAKVWDSKTGELITDIQAPGSKPLTPGEKPEATAVAFSPNDEILLIGDQWGACYIVSSLHGWSVELLPAHSRKISAIEFLPDGSGFLTASFDGTIQVWKSGPQGFEPQAVLHHEDRVVAMDLAADGKTLISAAGSNDERAVLRVWDLAHPDPALHSLSLVQIGGQPQTAGGRSKIVRSVAMHPSEPKALITVFDPDSPKYPYRIASWSWAERGSQYQLLSVRAQRDLSTAVYVPHRGNAILTVGGRGARLQKIGQLATTVALTYRPQGGVRSISFSADGKRLISASEDHSIKVWKLSEDGRSWKPEVKLTEAHQGAINSVEFHPNRADVFLSASDDGTAKVWQLRDGSWDAIRTLTVPEGESKPILQAVFVPGLGNNMAIITVGDAGAFFWQGKNNPPHELNARNPARCVAVTRDGRWICLGSGSTAQLYDLGTFEPVSAQLAGHSAEITSLAFTSDGSRLFSTSVDYTVKLWDTKSILANPGRANQQRELLTLEGHSDQVTSVTVAAGPEGPLVFTTGLDGQLIIWPSQPL